MRNRDAGHFHIDAAFRPVIFSNSARASRKVILGLEWDGAAPEFCK